MCNKKKQAESYSHVSKRMARPFNKVIQYIRLHWTKYETWFTFGVAIPFALSITFLSFLISDTGGERMRGVWSVLMFISLIIGIFIISFIARNSGKTETNTRLKNIEENMATHQDIANLTAAIKSLTSSINNLIERIEKMETKNGESKPNPDSHKK